MSDTDVRDVRLAEILDRAVRDVLPSPDAERMVRRGSARRAARLAASLATAAVFVAGAIWAAALVGSDRQTPADDATILTFASDEAPWTFEYPSGWDVLTTRSEGPELRVNVLRTTIADGPLPEGMVTLGPSSGSNDELVAALGDGGVAVLVERSWTHATPVGGEEWGPGEFANDASNPGWIFRERFRCDGTLCFRVIEWLGPNASEQDRTAAAAIAESVRLAPVERWSETDGERTTLHDEDDLFTVAYPADWSASQVPINDWVCSPYEILALATYRLRPGGEAVMDAQLPSKAVEDLGPNDILIWLNEDGSACSDVRESGDGSGFPDRPERFGPMAVCGDFDRLCPSDGMGQVPGVRGWWIAFEDTDRGFYVFVGMGEEALADPERAQQAWDVLDSLRFLPR